MRRGEIWTIAGGGDYTAKPRPAVVLQDNRFDAIDSVTVCLLTTDRAGAPLLRIPIEPDELNGLDAPSRIMVDKITTVRRSRLGMLMGRLGDEDIVRLNRAVLVFLGFTR
ncbi:MAG: type II toxin-antitoxin system PemK/MazF family toxin [Chloroflexi bacterium]|nr:type II toxin-antitoxin system PemK/MazF family toxin [Chloroflexota bacterium]